MIGKKLRALAWHLLYYIETPQKEGSDALDLLIRPEKRKQVHTLLFEDARRRPRLYKNITSEGKAAPEEANLTPRVPGRLLCSGERLLEQVWIIGAPTGERVNGPNQLVYLRLPLCKETGTANKTL